MRFHRLALLPAILLAAACSKEDPARPPPKNPPPEVLFDPARAPELLAFMNRGIALIERYDYGGATEEFRKAVRLSPGFYPAQFNLAVALVNNQQDPAVAEKALRAAADLAPKEAAPPFLLGMLLTQGVSPPRTAEAEAAFRRASELAPDDADSHFRLGLAAREQGRSEVAETEFSRALELNPFLGAALYQRGLNRRQLDRDDEGKADLVRFQELEKAKRVDGREISYGFMGPLGNCVRDLDRWLPAGAEAQGGSVRFVDVADPSASWEDGGGTLAVADLDGDGMPDLVAGGSAPAWHRNLGGWKFAPPAALPVPPADRRGRGGDVAVADFDGDGRLDVAVEGGGLVLGAAGGSPELRDHPEGRSTGRLLAADLDADGDVDLVAGRSLLLNDGRGNLSHTPGPADLPAEPWTPLLLRDIDDDGFPDLVGRESWVRNLRGGAFGGGGSLPLVLSGILEDLVSGACLALGDADGDGSDDRLSAVGDGLLVERRLPDGSIALGMHQATAWPLPEGRGKARAGAFSDFDGDGDLDLVVARSGRVGFAAHAGNAGRLMLHVTLAGVLHPNGRQFGWTNPRGLEARVEAVAGRLRVTRWMGLPVALGGKPDPGVLSFGLGGAVKADLVSIRWTEGVIQAEPDLPAGGAKPVRIEEVQRKAASCPVIFSWDGERFVFVADSMGGGGLGFLVKPGVYGPPDPTERVRIAPEQLRPRDGFYEIRFTEPLEEVVYADRLALVAVDHPSDAEAFPDERFGGSLPPPGERIFSHRTADAVLPVRATDHGGRDVLDALSRADRVYADGFLLHRDLLGFTEGDHWVEFDFAGRVPEAGEGERLILLLDGWIEYGYSRTFYAAAGAGVVPRWPTLELPDGAGGWRTGIADTGYPAGTPRTMTLDVTGIVTPAEPRFRLKTNLEIHWDRVRLIVDRGEGGIVRTAAPPAEADLRWAGFAEEVSPDGRLPKIHDYDRRVPSMVGFRAMAGEYTRFGDVRPLLLEADDRYVVFRNGEEIALRFAVADFPPLREGWTRTFLLETEGWCKDMDHYTATPATVEPLPFRGMSAYPPPAGEEYPDDDASREWRRTWNTRVVR